ALEVLVTPRERKTVILEANIGISADGVWDKIEAAVRSALVAHLSFENRDLGQDVEPSELIRVMQQVNGVTCVDLDLLQGATAEDVAACFLQQGGSLVELVLLRTFPEVPLGRHQRHQLVAPVVADLDRTRADGGPRILPAQLVCAEPTIRETMNLRR